MIAYIYLSGAILVLLAYTFYAVKYFSNYKALPFNYGYYSGIAVGWPIVLCASILYGLFWIILSNTKYKYLVDDNWFTKQCMSPNNKGCSYLQKFRGPYQP